MQESAKGHLMLLSDNDALHKDAKAGSDYGAKVYPTCQQALAARPPPAAASSGILYVSAFVVA